MILNNSITIQPPPITKSDGTIKTFNPITFNELDLTIIDNSKRKVCAVRICRIPWPVLLWRGSDYDTIGDYTQSQVESKLLEKFGDNPVGFLENLFVKPPEDEISNTLK
jgi:hypothetical protein